MVFFNGIIRKRGDYYDFFNFGKFSVQRVDNGCT